MTKALGVVFYRYSPRKDDHYKTQARLFFKYAKKFYHLIDALYVVDAGWGIDKEDLHPNTVIVSEDNLSHWEYMNRMTRLVKEDVFLLLDPDILIYDPKIIEMGFSLMPTNDVVGILDNSGSIDYFPANELRGVRRRFTPYMSFIKMKALREIVDVDFTPTMRDGKFEYDSMGELTYKLLEKRIDWCDFPDDRTTLRLHEDFTMTRDSNMDGPGFEWSEPLNASKRLGYYHVRNSSLGLSLLVEYEYDRPAYEQRKSITPFAEAMRLLAWQYLYDKYTGELERWWPKYLPVLADYGVPLEVWERYISEFEDFHSWIKESI